MIILIIIIGFIVRLVIISLLVKEVTLGIIEKNLLSFHLIMKKAISLRMYI